MSNPKVSEKNTKSQIMTAYLSAMSKIRELEKKSPDRKNELRVVKEKSVVEKATSVSLEKAVEAIEKLRKATSDAILSAIGEMTEIKEQINEANEAKHLLQAEIADLTEIKVESDTLIALQKAQSDAREEEEDEKIERRSLWQQEQQKVKEIWQKEQEDAREAWAKVEEAHDATVIERDTEFEKQWKRKIEDRSYDYVQQVKKENDEFNQRKISQERDLTDQRTTVESALQTREDAVKGHEVEFKELKAQTDAFPGQQGAAIANAVKEASENAKRSQVYEVNTLKKDHEIAVAVVTQQNKDLTTNLVAATQRLSVMESKLDAAYERVEGISKASISGASKTVFVQGTNEKKAS